MTDVSSEHLLRGRDAITDVSGVRVGHHTDARRPTGCTVVLTEAGAIAGVDVRGAAPGTRETDLLEPANLVDRVHAVLLCGGSAFGLDAATGVMRWLEARGSGFAVGAARVPIVPAAVLFDLGVGDPTIRPDANAGRAACEAACDTPPAQGSVGAGAGATIGKLFGAGRTMKGGIGTASVRVAGAVVGAIIAVNAVGDVIGPDGRVLAGARTLDGRRLQETARAILYGETAIAPAPGSSTTIGVVATDAVLTKPQARRLATVAHDGLARAIDPAHTLFDGDTLFALATGASGRVVDPVALGVAAARAVTIAVWRAVLHADGVLAGDARIPSIRELADRD